jgi:hypothetical protein
MNVVRAVPASPSTTFHTVASSRFEELNSAVCGSSAKFARTRSSSSCIRGVSVVVGDWSAAVQAASAVSTLPRHFVHRARSLLTAVAPTQQRQNANIPTYQATAPDV